MKKIVVELEFWEALEISKLLLREIRRMLKKNGNRYTGRIVDIKNLQVKIATGKVIE